MSAGAQAYAETQTWDMILDGLLRQYAQVIRDHAGEPHDHTHTPLSRRRERHNNGGLAHLFRFR
jgi:hypothetical protein